MTEFDHAPHDPLPDCDCGPCARVERDRLRAERDYVAATLSIVDDGAAPVEELARRARDELIQLRAISVCGCGDRFTEHDPGTCGNCRTAEVDRLRAELAEAKNAPPPKPTCRGVTDSRCNYLALCGAICTKCGRMHSGLPFADIDAARKEGT